MGTYGLMLRNALDVAEGHVDPSSWTHTIDGIEVFEQYRNPVWEYAYDRVYIGDIRNVVPTLGQYDIFLAGDVLEHFPRDEAVHLMNMALDHARVLIATTPRVVFEQGAWGGNVAETHHCLLEPSDFPDLALTLHAGTTALYACTRDTQLKHMIREAALGCPSQLLDPRTRFVVRARRKLLRIHSRFFGSKAPAEHMIAS